MAAAAQKSAQGAPHSRPRAAALTGLSNNCCRLQWRFGVLVRFAGGAASWCAHIVRAALAFARTGDHHGPTTRKPFRACAATRPAGQKACSGRPTARCYPCATCGCNHTSFLPSAKPKKDPQKRCATARTSHCSRPNYHVRLASASTLRPRAAAGGSMQFRRACAPQRKRRKRLRRCNGASRVRRVRRVRRARMLCGEQLRGRTHARFALRFTSSFI